MGDDRRTRAKLSGNIFEDSAPSVMYCLSLFQIQTKQQLRVIKFYTPMQYTFKWVTGSFLHNYSLYMFVFLMHYRLRTLIYNVYNIWIYT